MKGDPARTQREASGINTSPRNMAFVVVRNVVGAKTITHKFLSSGCLVGLFFVSAPVMAMIKDEHLQTERFVLKVICSSCALLFVHLFIVVLGAVCLEKGQGLPSGWPRDQ